MKEKEEVVKMLKADLAVKEREIEADKALQESRSDPESVTSSLTSSTAESGSAISAPYPNVAGTTANMDTSRGKLPLSSFEEFSALHDRIGDFRKHSSVFTTVAGKPDTTGGDIINGRSGHCTGSTGVSDLETSLSNGEKSDEQMVCSTRIQSDEALARSKNKNVDSWPSYAGKDTAFTNWRPRLCKKRPQGEVTSLDRSFELDYEEVFAKSNIPQLIASTSGKIVTCKSKLVTPYASSQRAHFLPHETA